MSRRESKHVNFASTANDSRSRHSRDSGLGSSAEHARAGAVSDRAFTDRDRETQRRDVGALQEALNDVNLNLRKHEKKNLAMEEQLSDARKSLRSKENEIRALHDDNSALKEQVRGYKADIDELRDDIADLEQQLLNYGPGFDAPMMSGASGHSPKGKSKSRHDHDKPDKHQKEQKARLQERIKPKSPTDEASSSTATKKAHRSSRDGSRPHESSHRSSGGHGRRPSVSTPSGRPYIESDPSRSIPRTSYPPVAGPIYHQTPYPSGNYVAVGLPEDPRPSTRH